MNRLTPREIRMVDRFQQHCCSAAQRPLDEFRLVTARTCAMKCGWAVGLLSLYAFFTLLAQIV